jgi:hypothetical protein
MPRAVQKGSSGCISPAAARARQHSSCCPGNSADHTQRHACHACGLVRGSRSASAQMAPPSALTATPVIVERPDHARPVISWVPRPTTRVRVRKSGYEEQRNTSAMPVYELNYQLASLEPPSPEQQQLLGVLYGNQADTDRFFRTLCGTVPVQEFFAPDNLGRIMASAAAPPA